ncbi:FKBP-type peptidyl-prolyl cis-trans isomerase [uncultured Thiohalocapsa sp.]|uniref:FKBP-type peptidyl-prolyl cis-trans isomerase n=1 Tax=uncultured Thiohalocapsa sp. TaxID=768990 RepID=UPI00014EBF56|nr:FKBP-type peptidyl-prolyl cis-trans isomerase [uncultured Thiohalocapsa sp.]
MPVYQAESMPHATPRIGPRSRVTLHLSLTLEDGTEVLSTFGDEPLSFTMGDGTLAPGLEEMLLDLPAGAETRLLAEGAAIFGAPEPDLVHDLAVADLPADFTAAPGQVIAFATPGGQETPGTVLAVSADHVRVDFNHPLAHRGLHARVQVQAVR